MKENPLNKDEEGTTSEKPEQEDSAWLRWIKKTSITMNKRFRHYNRDFVKNLKKKAKR